MVDFARFEVEDHVGLVTIDHPPVNTLNSQLCDELISVFDTISTRDDVYVAILTGTGERAFCSGADLKESKDFTIEQIKERADKFSKVVWLPYNCAVPVIAAINGPAMGIGCLLSFTCDMVVASEKAAWAISEILVGRVGGAKVLRRALPEIIVRKMAYTGQRISVQEAYRLGVIDRIVPAEELLSQARELAEELSNLSPVAVRLRKEILNNIEDLGIREGYRLEQERAEQMWKTKDYKEADKAFLEKRETSFGDK